MHAHAAIRFAITTVMLAATALLHSSAHASWLSKITGVDVDIPSMTLRLDRPHPEAIPDAIRHLPQDAINFLNPAGVRLAFLLRQAHAQAIGSAQPIPERIRDRLTAFFPAGILDRSRFTTQARSGVSLASLLMQADNQIGAITVDDVIIFRGESEAANTGIWAHELVHVAQYSRMGIDGFAAMYAGPGARTIENDAYSWQNHVVQALNSTPNGSAGAPQYVDNSGPAFKPLSWSDFQQGARQVVPPGQCIRMQQVAITTLFVANVCPVPIIVTGAVVDGFMLPCNGPVCFFPPNNRHVVPTRPGGVSNLIFAFSGL